MKTGKSIRNETARENAAQHGEEGGDLPSARGSERFWES